MEWSEEKIAGYVSKGWSLSYDKARDRFKLQKRVKGKSKSYSLPKQFNEFCWKLKEELKSQVREEEDVEEEKEGKKEQKKLKKSSDYAGAGRSETLKALDRSHAKLVQNITERVSWFADVLNEVGFYATLTAMQVAKVSPEEFYDYVVDFKSPQEFADFVKDRLVALLEAKEEAQKIVEYRKKLDAMDVKLALLEEVIDHLKRQRDEATISLYAALATMDEDQLRNFVMNLMVAQYGLSVKAPIYNNMNINTANIGGVEVGGTGRASGEGVSEEEEYS